LSGNNADASLNNKKTDKEKWTITDAGNSEYHITNSQGYYMDGNRGLSTAKGGGGARSTEWTIKKSKYDTTAGDYKVTLSHYGDSRYFTDWYPWGKKGYLTSRNPSNGKRRQQDWLIRTTSGANCNIDASAFDTACAATTTTTTTPLPSLLFLQGSAVRVLQG